VLYSDYLMVHKAHSYEISIHFVMHHCRGLVDDNRRIKMIKIKWKGKGVATIVYNGRTMEN